MISYITTSTTTIIAISVLLCPIACTIVSTNVFIHCPKYDDNVSFQGLLKFAPT